MDKRAAEQYLNQIFGTNRGYVAVAYKDTEASWQDSQFAWPADKAKLLGWAEIHQDANVFICPALRKDAHTRKKGDLVPTKWLWADVDWQGVPESKRAEVKQRIAELGTLVVASGTGDNAHVYVELTRPVDAAQHAKLNTGLRDYLYGDNKQADNSLLRLPGTMNWKTDRGSMVSLREGNGKKHSSAVLLKRRAFRDAKVVTDDIVPTDWVLTEVEGLSRRMKARLAMPVDEARARYGNRHNAVNGMVKDLHRAGFDSDQIHSLMNKFPAGLHKMADENGYDFHLDIDRCLARIIAIEEEVQEILNDDEEDMPLVSDEQYNREKLNEGVDKELFRRAVKRAADQAEATQGHTEPPPDASVSLSDALSAPPAPVQWLIEGLCSAEANVVITGQYKSGKTKLMLASLVTALADNEPFLGSKPVHVPHTGAVVGHWNLEMSALDLIDKYLRPAGIKNPHNVHLANWRGYKLNILTDMGRDSAVEWLKSRNVQVWTLDSWTALCRMCGVDPNSGVEVSQLLGRIDEIKQLAGVKVFFFLAHTARSSSEADKPGTRGASELDDHVDSRWMFTVDRSDVRFLQAEGRDTQMPAISLDFDEETGRSVIGAVTRQSAASDGWVQTIASILQAMRGRGLNKISLVRKMKEVRTVGNRQAENYIAEAVDSGIVEVKEVPRVGGGRAEKLHYLAGFEKPEGDPVRKATPGMVNLAGVRMAAKTRASK